MAKASWMFGSLLLAFILGVFIFVKTPLPDWKLKILAFVCALLAGFFAFFFTGTIAVNITTIPSRAGQIGLQAAGGMAAFAVVLWWWGYSGATPIPADNTNPTKPFKTTFKFTQHPFNISASSARSTGADVSPATAPSSGLNYGFSSLGFTDSVKGQGVKVRKVRVVLDVANKSQIVCCDVWVFLGPSPFPAPFTKEGGGIIQGPDPSSIDPGTGLAPTEVKLVIGAPFGMTFDQGTSTFWISYDFETGAKEAFPSFGKLKEAVNERMDIPDGLYAQVLVWMGDPRGSLDINGITLEVEGTVSSAKTARLPCCDRGIRPQQWAAAKTWIQFGSNSTENQTQPKLGFVANEVSSMDQNEEYPSDHAVRFAATMALTLLLAGILLPAARKLSISFRRTVRSNWRC